MQPEPEKMNGDSAKDINGIDSRPLLGDSSTKSKESRRQSSFAVDSSKKLTHFKSINPDKTTRRTAKFGSKKYWFGVAITIFSVVLDGFVPGLNKYLEQDPKISGLQITVIRAVFGVGFASIWVLPRHFQKSDPLVRWKLKHVFGYPFLWILIFFRFRNLAANYAPQFTLSYYVGILQLFVPIFTALGAKLFLKDKLPRFTWLCMIVVAIGTFLTVSGGVFTGDSTLRLHAIDILGIGLALLSAFGSAGDDVYFSFLDTSYSTISLFWLTGVFELVMLLPISVSAEDWSVFTEINAAKWIVLVIGRVVAGYMVVDICKIEAVRLVGAPLVATIQPFAGIVTLVFGTSPFLNEPVNGYGIAGACLVTAAVMLYVAVQYYDAAKLERLQKVKENALAEDDNENGFATMKEAPTEDGSDKVTKPQDPEDAEDDETMDALSIP